VRTLVIHLLGAMRIIAMRLTRITVLILATMTGCTSARLRYSVNDQARTLTELQYEQVLANLAMISAQPWALPSMVVVRDGSDQIQDVGSATATLYLNTGNSAPPSLTGTRTVVEQWGVRPVTDDTELKVLQMAYQRAVGISVSLQSDFKFANELAHELKKQLSEPENPDYRLEDSYILNYISGIYKEPGSEDRERPVLLTLFGADPSRSRIPPGDDPGRDQTRARLREMLALPYEELRILRREVVTISDKIVDYRFAVRDVNNKLDTLNQKAAPLQEPDYDKRIVWPAKYPGVPMDLPGPGMTPTPLSRLAFPEGPEGAREPAPSPDREANLRSRWWDRPDGRKFLIDYHERIKRSMEHTLRQAEQTKSELEEGLERPLEKLRTNRLGEIEDLSKIDVLTRLRQMKIAADEFANAVITTNSMNIITMNDFNLNSPQNYAGLKDLDIERVQGKPTIRVTQPAREIRRQVRQVENDLLEIDSGWYHVGRKRDIPKNACFVGHCNDRYAWVSADGLAQLSEFTLKVIGFTDLIKEGTVVTMPGGPRFTPTPGR
jgi:hypothetical protein